MFRKTLLVEASYISRTRGPPLQHRGTTNIAKMMSKARFLATNLGALSARKNAAQLVQQVSVNGSCVGEEIR